MAGKAAALKGCGALLGADERPLPIWLTRMMKYFFGSSARSGPT
jgi:hypothetical protein